LHRFLEPEAQWLAVDLAWGEVFSETANQILKIVPERT
jgi:hypothetical protein